MQEVRGRLAKLAFRGDLDDDDLDLSDVVDDWTVEDAGWSFLKHGGNCFGPRPTMIEDQLSYPTSEEAKDWIRGESALNVDTARKWCREEHELRRWLMAMLYMAVGIPARRTEISNLKWANSADGKRNFVVRDGTFAVFTMYSKRYTYNGNIPCEIWRHVEQEAGQLLGFYLIAVLPFRHKIDNALHESNGVSPFLFVHGRTDGDKLLGDQAITERLRTATAAALAQDRDPGILAGRYVGEAASR